MQAPDHSLIDTRAVLRARTRAAANEHAFEIETLAGERLLERLDGLRLAPDRILDLGCGRGQGTTALARRFRQALLIAIDPVRELLRQVPRRSGWFRPTIRRVQATPGRLPLADASIDLVYANLVADWLLPLPTLIDELRRVMKPGGLMLLSAFGRDTLIELRRACEETTGRMPAALFGDVQTLGNALLQAGFLEPVLDTDWLQTRHPDVDTLWEQLKTAGLGNVACDRSRGLNTARKLEALRETCHRHSADSDGIRVSWELLYASAWAPPAGVPRRGRFGEEVAIPVDQIGMLHRP
ncbi:MAG: methyltransferase domain-containing protein [Wenzhouxiangellaceae bacterium]